MIMPLPIIPHRLPEEGMGSWLHRTAKIYTLAPHELITDWSGHAQSINGLSIEARVVDTGLWDYVINKMRITDASITEANEWIIRNYRDTAVCPYCLVDDDHQGRPRYLRAIWSFAWCVTCPSHPSKPLMALRNWDAANLLLFGESGRRNAAGTLRHCQRRRYLPKQYSLKRPSIHAALLAIGNIEQAIQSAIAGRAPRQASWGKITAPEFLKVVQDTTAFALSQFDGANPLANDHTSRFVDPSPIRCFDRAIGRRAFNEVTELRPLVDAGDVGWRRRALFIAYELMNAKTTRSWLPRDKRLSRSKRIAHLLSQHNSTGLTWLSERMQRWPEDYRETWWSGSRWVGLQ